MTSLHREAVAAHAMPGSLADRGGAKRSRRALVHSFVLVAALSACKGVLEVQNTTNILSEALDAPAAVPAITEGVAGDFGVIYMYNALTTGYSSHELQNVGSMTGWRDIENGIAYDLGSVGNLFNNAGRAFFVATDAARRFTVLFGADSANRRVETARVHIYAGFTALILADNFCAPTLLGGPPLTDAAVYARADTEFTQALAVATAAKATAQSQQALAGRARARLFRGDYAGAKADAVQVPDAFVFIAIYSQNSSRENNDIALNAVASIRKEASVYPTYYAPGSLYNTDPRTPFLNKGPTTVGNDAIRQFVEQTKYPLRQSPAVIASGLQARLIEAEAELGLNNPARAIVLINGVRAAAKLAPYAGAATNTAVFAQLLYERSAQMWLEGQRFVDLRRTNDPFLNDRAKCYPVSYEESQSNPNFLKP